MTNIKVGRYADPELQKDWQGWIEPEDSSWVVFITGDGQPFVLLKEETIVRE